ncbi:hypothetical protein I2I05_03310 [Hymenobacter sp. BT683]|uniref:Uncharacterized protein n=1 Tax=Hymenobacter jeongseonensis TaxID=2791027 RepID=A0ABS0IDH2_9BACT|nr:hypothetical protein [Hymenobacter jeongseonensis]MBF9236415.1 hypothetical protein [Hymenobacter jeongseonensis]
MKSLLKFTLLSALIIGGKISKQPTTTAVAQTLQPAALPDTSVVFVNQVTPSDPAKQNQTKDNSQQNGIGLLANLF